MNTTIENAIMIFEIGPDAEPQDEQRRQRDARQAVEAEEVGLDGVGDLAPRGEQDADRHADHEAEQQADDSVEQRDAGVGQHVAVHEHVPQPFRDGARLADPERIDEPGRGGFPGRDHDDAQDDLRRHLGSEAELAGSGRRHGGVRFGRVRLPGRKPPDSGSSGQCKRHAISLGREGILHCNIADRDHDIAVSAKSTLCHKLRRSPPSIGCSHDEQSTTKGFRGMIFPRVLRAMEAKYLHSDSAAEAPGCRKTGREWKRCAQHLIGT